MQASIGEQRQRLTLAREALLAQRADMTLKASAGDADARRQVVVLRQQSIALDQEIADLVAVEALQRRKAEEAEAEKSRQWARNLVDAVPALLTARAEAAEAMDVKLHELRELARAYLQASTVAEDSIRQAHEVARVAFPLTYAPTEIRGSDAAFSEVTFWRVGNACCFRELFAGYAQHEIATSNYSVAPGERESPPKEIFAAEVNAKNASVLAGLPNMKGN